MEVDPHKTSQQTADAILELRIMGVDPHKTNQHTSDAILIQEDNGMESKWSNSIKAPPFCSLTLCHDLLVIT